MIKNTNFTIFCDLNDILYISRICADCCLPTAVRSLFNFSDFVCNYCTFFTFRIHRDCLDCWCHYWTTFGGIHIRDCVFVTCVWYKTAVNRICETICRKTSALNVCYGQNVLQCIVTLPSAARWSIVMTYLFVCLCVCLPARISSELHVRSSPIFVHVTCGHGLVLHLTALRYDMYFRFHVWHHICTHWDICTGCRCNSRTASEPGVAACVCCNTCCRLRLSSRSRRVCLLYTSLFTVHVVTEKRTRKHTTRKIDKKHKNTYLTNN